jgi:hypothetical protein
MPTVMMTIQPVDPRELERALEGSRFVAERRDDHYVLCLTTDAKSTWADAQELLGLIRGVRKLGRAKDDGAMVGHPTPMTAEERAASKHIEVMVPKRRTRKR